MVWNTNRTDTQQGIVAGIQAYAGNGDLIHAYTAQPDGPGPYPGVVLIHHVPGWDEFYREFARRFAEHGYTVIVPNLSSGRPRHPDEVAAKARADGGWRMRWSLIEASLAWIKAQASSNGKVGVIGSCFGRAPRHAHRLEGRGLRRSGQSLGRRRGCDADRVDGQAARRGGRLTPQLSCPLLGLFGNDDQHPKPGRGDHARGGAEGSGQDVLVPSV